MSFLIVTFNRKDILLDTLKKINETQSLSKEIIVIDNNSSDGTYGEMQKIGKGLVYEKLDANYGIGAYNRGFKLAKGRFIVILDDDSYPAFDLKDAILEFEEDRKLGLIAGNVINILTGKSEFSDEFLSHKMKDTHYFIGCAAIARKEVLKKCSYYDEHFFLYFNENDLAARIIKKGYKIRFYREYKFLHGGSQVSSRTGLRFYYEFRNLLWYLIKNFPFPYLFKRLITELRKNFFYAKNNKDMKFYLKALFDTLISFRHLLKDREPFRREELHFVLGKDNAKV